MLATAKRGEFLNIRRLIITRWCCSSLWTCTSRNRHMSQTQAYSSTFRLTRSRTPFSIPMPPPSEAHRQIGCPSLVAWWVQHRGRVQRWLPTETYERTSANSQRQIQEKAYTERGCELNLKQHQRWGQTESPCWEKGYIVWHNYLSNWFYILFMLLI